MREVVAVHQLHKTFGDTEVLRGLDFVLEGPQLIGILGPNGAGKTTLLDILEGLSHPSSGSVTLFGAAGGPYPRARVGVVLQKEFLLDGVRVGDYAELFAAIQGVAQGRQRIVQRAGLEDRLRLPLANLSGGEAQRLFIAAASVHDPDLLFLDEPTSQLDPNHKRAVGEMLRSMSRERTVVITTHDLREAEGLCDFVLFLQEGQIRAQGTPAELLQGVPGEGSRTLEHAFFHYCSV